MKGFFQSVIAAFLVVLLVAPDLIAERAMAIGDRLRKWEESSPLVVIEKLKKEEVASE